MASLSQSIICAVVMLCPLVVTAADDEYLKMLEGEAADVQLDQSGQLERGQHAGHDAAKITVDKDWKFEGGLEGDIIPPGLSQSEFTRVLKENFYGSFVFYQRLNSNDQKTVFYHYTKASPAHLDVIRQDILDHLKK